MSNKKYFLKTLTVLFGLTILFFSCELDDPKVDISASDIISLTIDNESLIADGNKVFLLTVDLLDKTDPNQDVTFRTSYGEFVNGNMPGTQETVIRSSGRVAEAQLKVTTEIEERIFVSAELGGYSIDKEIATTPSYPEILNISSDKLILEKNGGGVINVSIEATKSVGNVSDNIPLNFSFIDTDTSGMILNFNNVEYLSSEMATVEIKSQNDSIGNFNFLINVPINDLGDIETYQLDLRVE